MNQQMSGLNLNGAPMAFGQPGTTMGGWVGPPSGQTLSTQLWKWVSEGGWRTIKGTASLQPSISPPLTNHQSTPRVLSTNCSFPPSLFFPNITLLLEIVSSTLPLWVNWVIKSVKSWRDWQLFPSYLQFFFLLLVLLYIFLGWKKNYISAKKAAGPIYKRLIYHYQIDSE